MGRCWTCGAYVESLAFECPACQSVKELQNLRKEIPASFDELAQIQKEGFERLSRGLSEVATVIEWGIEELSWHLQKQCDLLQSIDHTLRTPSQTQANEWRQMGEVLRSRGVLDKAEEMFSKALETNPLDYRIYIGLAKIYLQTNKFDEAKSLLQKSLPHAPSGNAVPSTKIENYKSYSYRLIGRIHACNENYQQAISSLKLALEFSPQYAEASYDCAQYSSQNGQKKDCILFLKKAINDSDTSIYYHLARKEKNFDPFRREVQSLLKQIEEETKLKALEEIRQAETKLRSAEKNVATVEQAMVIARKQKLDLGVPYLRKLCEDAQTTFDQAKQYVASKRYPEIPEVRSIISEALSVVTEINHDASSKLARYERIRSAQIAKARSYLLPSVWAGGFYGFIIGLVVGGITSFVIGNTMPLIYAILLGPILGIALFVFLMSRKITTWGESLRIGTKFPSLLFLFLGILGSLGVSILTLYTTFGGVAPTREGLVSFAELLKTYGYWNAFVTLMAIIGVLSVLSLASGLGLRKRSGFSGYVGLITSTITILIGFLGVMEVLPVGPYSGYVRLYMSLSAIGLVMLISIILTWKEVSRNGS